MSTEVCDFCKKRPGHDWVSLRIMRHGAFFDNVYNFCGPCYDDTDFPLRDRLKEKEGVE